MDHDPVSDMRLRHLPALLHHDSDASVRVDAAVMPIVLGAVRVGLYISIVAERLRQTLQVDEHLCEGDECTRID
jgi:hypothetical protein